MNLVSACMYGEVAVAGTVTMKVAMTYISHVDSADTDDLGALTDSRYLFGTSFCLLDIAPKNTSICAQVDESFRLYLADGTSASSHEDDPVV